MESHELEAVVVTLAAAAVRRSAFEVLICRPDGGRDKGKFIQPPRPHGHNSVHTHTTVKSDLALPVPCGPRPFNLPEMGALNLLLWLFCIFCRCRCHTILSGAPALRITSSPSSPTLRHVMMCDASGGMKCAHAMLMIIIRFGTRAVFLVWLFRRNHGRRKL